MASHQHYVNTASSGGDGTTNNTSGGTAAFASLSAYVAGITVVATDDYVVDCCGTAADTTAVNVNFATHLTTGTLIIRANASDPAGKYNGTSTISTAHYRLAPASGSPLTLSEKNVTVDGIQIEASGGGVAAINGIVLTNPTSINVRNCRLRAVSVTESGIGTGNTVITINGTMVVENNLIVGFNLQGLEYRTGAFFSPNVTFRHNTIYGDGSAKGIYITEQANGSGTYTVKANAIGNSGASNCFDITMASGTVTYDDNATEDAQGTTGEIAIGVLTDAWTNPGTGQSNDFTVKNTSSSLYNAVNPTLVTTDITGLTRDGTNHDVGAFEFQVPLTGPARRLSLLGIG